VVPVIRIDYIPNKIKPLDLVVRSIMNREDVCGEFPLLCFGEEKPCAIIPVTDPVHFALLSEKSKARGEDTVVFRTGLSLLKFEGCTVRGTLKSLLSLHESIAG